MLPGTCVALERIAISFMHPQGPSSVGAKSRQSVHTVHREEKSKTCSLFVADHVLRVRRGLGKRCGEADLNLIGFLGDLSQNYHLLC